MVVIVNIYTLLWITCFKRQPLPITGLLFATERRRTVLSVYGDLLALDKFISHFSIGKICSSSFSSFAANYHFYSNHYWHYLFWNIFSARWWNFQNFLCYFLNKNLKKKKIDRKCDFLSFVKFLSQPPSSIFFFFFSYFLPHPTGVKEWANNCLVLSCTTAHQRAVWA